MDSVGSCIQPKHKIKQLVEFNHLKIGTTNENCIGSAGRRKGHLKRRKKRKQGTVRKELNFMRIIQVKAHENNYLFIFSKDI